jgi:hypothetical protein
MASPSRPARFTRKVKAWESDNGVGRLMKRHPAEEWAGRPCPAFLHLLTRIAGAPGSIVMVITRVYSVDSALTFELVERPQPGMVRVLTSFRGLDELRHLASDMAAAQAWMARNPYSEMRMEEVTDDEMVVLPQAMGRAA